MILTDADFVVLTALGIGVACVLVLAALIAKTEDNEEANERTKAPPPD